MAYVLSLQPHSPLKRSFSETPYLQPASPLSSDSLNTVHRRTPNSLSAASLISLGSVQTSPGFGPNENTPPRVTSRSLLDLLAQRTPASKKQNASDSQCGLESPAYHAELPPLPPSKSSFVRGHVISAQDADSIATSPSPLRALDDVTDSDSSMLFAVGTPTFVLEEASSPSESSGESEYLQEAAKGTQETVEKVMPFRRWMSTLRRRNKHQAKGLQPHLSKSRNERHSRHSGHRKSNSLTSSLAFVTAVKSASITLASTSIAPLSRFGGRNSRREHDTRSSAVSETRHMDAAHKTFTPVMDERAHERAIQRRRTLEEIIAGEEGYIGDLKFLINMYFTMLASAPWLSSQTRTFVQRNVAQIVQLHEELLGELHSVIPNSEYTQEETLPEEPPPRPKHTRWHSVDIVPGRIAGLTQDRRQQRHSMDVCRLPEAPPVALTADTKVVLDVAKVFGKFMKRFFAYEEYSAQYAAMNDDMDFIQKTKNAWSDYERGTEALSSSVVAINKRNGNSQKGLTFGDLLIKPIQRMLRYPLHFQQLRRFTPVADDPVAYAELDKVYSRLVETGQRMNSAKDDPRARRLIENTWLLQDRLVFPDELPLPRSLLSKLLGHVVLCGVLYVAYQTNERTEGKFLICILYKSCLLLAVMEKGYLSYNIVAAINLANGSIDASDNGRGLQCHTAPFSWKLTFESNHHLYEVIMSACSSEEEEVWKSHLQTHITAENNDLVEGRSSVQDLFSSLSLDLKAIGPVFGQPEAFTRRMSIRRAATLGPKSNLHQVIIKNTQTKKVLAATQSTTSLPVARSQSHLSAAHVPTLAPRRAERVRLETALGDVWTKDVLPFPGMGPRRAENPIRASANSVMRKLSMASITSNFSKKSGSYGNLSQLRKDEVIKAQKRSPPGSGASVASTSRKRPVVVDFHNAPAAFLPADFELKTPDGKIKRPAIPTIISEKKTPDMQKTPSRKNERAGTPVKRNNLKARTKLFKFWLMRGDGSKSAPSSPSKASIGS
ncbi:Dbl homology domain-containing protein [Saccharata proteae CBS 121410]|uniref:Dbl homology domain-containing protein n=1 Tax=Saccharata proteae CBS 121410 TaxID=1314787 RepID=A0A9P4M189_9PEZI|nr:Dbl homology domain-containing protein [Saccharata proteae CBS 121410]